MTRSQSMIHHEVLDFGPLNTPGLFITGTDTEVGKTVITCAIADVLARMGLKVGVCKPMATGARSEREGLVSDDAQALAYFADLDPAIGGLPLVTPILERMPAAPAVALAQAGRLFDPKPIARSLAALDKSCDIILVEGVGGVLVPIDPERPQRTVVDCMLAIGYPAVVVTRADLGTLNHTALTCEVLRQRRCPIAGIVINQYEPDSPDPIFHTNHQWLQLMNRLPILATVPRVGSDDVQVAQGVLHDEVRAAVALTDWRTHARKQQRSA